MRYPETAYNGKGNRASYEFRYLFDVSKIHLNCLALDLPVIVTASPSVSENDPTQLILSKV